MSSTALVVVTDGREDYLERSLSSAQENLPSFDEFLVVDDTAHKLGFAGAVQAGFALALKAGVDWVFWLEEDFVFNRPVPLDEMVGLLEDRPYLSQLALRRQPVGAEIPHGGFMEMQPGWYSEHTDGERSWVEHKRNWTTNPALFRADICSLAWPDAPDSEGHFGFGLIENGLPWGIPGDEVRFGFWGGMEDGKEWVHHIGEARSGHGY